MKPAGRPPAKTRRSASRPKRREPKRSLADLRNAVARADADILRLVARRLELARRIGHVKLQAGLPIQDFGVERLVIDRNRARALAVGLARETADDLTKMLIRHAIRVQHEGHEARRRTDHSVRSQRVLVVGGEGGMGHWLARYFDSFGHEVAIYDPKARRRDRTFPHTDDLKKASHDAEVIALATPIGATAVVLRRIARWGTGALVFDVASLKTPIASEIESALESGVRTASIHPLFGPAVTLLSGRNIIFCRTAPNDFSAEVRRLFEDTTARLITIPIERHDELMGQVLGLSHIVNLVFASTLASSGIPFAELRLFGSTTFLSQLEVARRVVHENQDLYYEIQAENASTEKVLRSFASSLERYSRTISQKDRRRFKALMEQARRYLESEREAGGRRS